MNKLNTVLKHNILSSFINKTAHPILEKLINARLFIFYYHMISDDDVLHVKYLYPYKRVHQFEADMDFLLRRYKPVSIEELIDQFKNGKSLADRSFLLTFDDGFREMFDVVSPILEKKGIPATFFINSAFIDNNALCFQHKASLLADYYSKITPNIKKTIDAAITREFQRFDVEYANFNEAILSIQYQKKDLIDRIGKILSYDFNGYLKSQKPYLSAEQIKILIKKGFGIGAHSIDHPLYAKITQMDQLHQTIESMKIIKDTFCVDYGAFAFPHGDDGVNSTFFTELHGTGLVDISFGTGGMLKDIFGNHMQRCSLERPPLPAEKIITYQLVRTLVKQVLGKGRIARD